MRRFYFALVALVLVLAAQPLVAVTYYVGTCKIGSWHYQRCGGRCSRGLDH